MTRSKKEKIILGLYLLIIILIFSGSTYPPNTAEPTPDEKAQLLSEMPRGQKIPRSEFDEFIPKLLKFSRETSNLTVSPDCQIYPFVFRVTTDSYYTITNLDTSNHKITIDSGHIYELLPGQSIQAKADLGGTGLHGIFCDQTNEISGILFSTTCYKEVTNDPSDIMKNCQW